MIIKFDELSNIDLIQNAIYEGGISNNYGSDPLIKLFKIEGCEKGIGSSGGFRKALKEFNDKLVEGEIAFVVLSDTKTQKEWPNKYDEEKREFIYYGDNRKVGNTLLNTKNGGNKFLLDIFEKAYSSENRRNEIPPVFIFSSTKEGRNKKFIGLGIPKVKGKNKDEVLEVVQTETKEGICENYKAIFTVLNTKKIKREWLKDLKLNNLNSENAPEEWIDFINDSLEDYNYTNKTQTFNKVNEFNEIEAKSIEYNENIIDEVFNNIEISEGEKIKRVVEIKKRSKTVRDTKLQSFEKKHGKVFCEICFEEDRVVLDVHHEYIRVAEMEEGHKTKLEDLKILCANCHRKIHGHNFTVEKLKEVYSNKFIHIEKED